MKNRIVHILVDQRKYRNPDYNATRLAAELGVTTWTLSRLLKKEFGKTYTGMIHELRVRDAMRMLTGKQKRKYGVDDIAVFVGFSNRTSFYEAFRKYTGTTPEQFREDEKLKSLRVEKSKSRKLEESKTRRIEESKTRKIEESKNRKIEKSEINTYKV